MVKPDWLSWDAVQECQHKAHEQNTDKGRTMLCANLSGEQLAYNIGKGICFVAINNEKCIGTASIKIIEGNKGFPNYWRRGKVAYLCMDAVIPEYQGMSVYSKLQEMRYNYIIHNIKSINVIEIDTAEWNKKMISILKSNGYSAVLYKTFPNTTYYSIVFAKWINNTKYKKITCYILYTISYFLVHIIYKPGKIFRFSLNKNTKK